jgi:hypothetical protein
MLLHLTSAFRVDAPRRPDPGEVAFATSGPGRAEMPDLKTVRQIVRAVLENFPNVRCAYAHRGVGGASTPTRP